MTARDAELQAENERLRGLLEEAVVNIRSLRDRLEEIRDSSVVLCRARGFLITKIGEPS